jgi:O-antigen/teichoic acid export membrane protein/D-alanine-D-alanine ligase-like ATP-grasp enzyme
MSDERTPESFDGDTPASAAHVRGSTLLLIGRLISLAINFATQALIARHLATTEYGAVALAFAIAGLGQVMITLGLHRGATRFITADLERQAYPRVVGTIVLNVAVIVALGAVLLALVAAGQRGLTNAGLLDPTATGLLLILLLLAPIEALDDLMINLYAVFDSPGSIFIRRYVLGPALRLGVALLVVAGNGGGGLLAVGYVVASFFGLALYGALFLRLLSDRGVLRAVRGRRLEIPAREVIGSSLPLLSTDAIWLLINTFPILVLSAASGLSQVAAYQVVRPAAALNLLVATSFHVLYLPVAARLAARGDRAGANELYWRTTIWVSVITFPIFAATFALGKPLTELVFGERYEDSGIFLSILSVGYLVHAALGFNATTLAAYGHHRTVAISNVTAALISVAGALLLIPPFGALGAAVVAAGTLFAQNGLLQIGLRRKLGIDLLHRDAAGVYAVIATAAIALILLVTFAPVRWWGFVLVGLTSVVVLYRARHAMQLGTVFPAVYPLSVRVVRPLGRTGRRIASGLDLARSLPPADMLRRVRQARHWAAGDTAARSAVYRSIWSQAGAAIGATVVPNGDTLELRRADRSVTLGDRDLRLDSQAALDRALDKPAVTRALRADGLPVPSQLAFRFGAFEAALAFLQAAPGPCVVKPARGRTGSGVTTDVRSAGDLARAMIRAGTESDDLLIEHQLRGTVYRLLFLDGELLDVLERQPPRVVGDGHSTVGALVDAENGRRVRAQGRAGLSMLKLDLDSLRELSISGLTPDSVPAEDQVVTVKGATNQNGARDNRSVANGVGEDLVRASRRAVELVGLRLAGVDVVTDDPVGPLADHGAILEVNGLPGIHYHYLVHPATRAVPVAIPIAEALLDSVPATARRTGVVGEEPRRIAPAGI